MLQFKLETLDESENLSETEMQWLGVSTQFLADALKEYDDEGGRWDNSRAFFARIFGDPVHEQKRIPASRPGNKAAGIVDVMWGIEDDDKKRILPYSET